MLRLRSRVLAHLLPSPATSLHHLPHPPASNSLLHRLLSAAASPHTGFAVEEYLVETCGLTRAQALKASAKLSHLKSPSRPDAVVAFLVGLGLSAADIAAAVSRDPQLLCAGVETTLGPNVAGLADLGLSRSQVARLAALAGKSFRSKSIVSNLPYCHSLLGSYENLAKVEYLKKLFRWSDADVGVVFRTCPMVLVMSKERLQRKSEFLISEVGLVPAYIAHRPVMLGLSLEGRLRPRYYVMRFLKENGLLDREWSYFSAVMMTEKVFVEKHICPHKEAAPNLAQDYAGACRGQAPTRFRFA